MNLPAVKEAEHIHNGFSVSIYNARESMNKDRKAKTQLKTVDFVDDLRSTNSLMEDLIEQLSKREVQVDRWGKEYVQVLIYASDKPRNDSWVTVGNNSDTFRDIAIATVISYSKNVDSRLTIKRIRTDGIREVWVRMYLDPNYKEYTIQQFFRGIFMRTTRYT